MKYLKEKQVSVPVDRERVLATFPGLTDAVKYVIRCEGEASGIMKDAPFGGLTRGHP